MTNSVPPAEAVWIEATKIPTEKRGLRKKPNSTIGCGQRSSQNTKPPNSANPNPNEPSVFVEPHPWEGASIVAQTNPVTLSTESTTPNGSNRAAAGFRDSGIAHHPKPNATTT